MKIQIRSPPFCEDTLDYTRLIMSKGAVLNQVVRRLICVISQILLCR